MKAQEPVQRQCCLSPRRSPTVRSSAPASVNNSSKLKFCFPRSRSDTPACVGEPEQILQARMYRYVILFAGLGITDRTG